MAPGPAEPGKKREGKRWTAKEQVTDAMYVSHLDGRAGLGIVPIRDDDTCVWGCGDIDDYNLDHVTLLEKIKALGLPLVLCRTKSGGGHCFLFTSVPVPAALMRDRLKDWMTALGFPKIEIFPKQDSLTVDGEESGNGSWLNLPYFAGARTTRYALDPDDGARRTLEQFLDLADEREIDLETLATWPTLEEPVVINSNEIFPGGPPCLNKLCANCDVELNRNEILFNIAQYYRKVDQETAHEKAMEANKKVFVAPLSDHESRMTVGSALKREYNYRCNNEPLASACDKKACRKCEFGVGGNNGDSHTPRGGTAKLKYGPLQRHDTEPATWRWFINDVPIELTGVELTNQRAFLVKVLDATKVYGAPMKPTLWDAFITQSCINSENIKVPREAQRSGHSEYLLRQFCTGRAVARNMDEVLLGKPYLKDGRHYFLPNYFTTFCQSQKFVYTEKELYFWLLDKLKVERMQIKGVSLDVWSVEEFDSQRGTFDPPRDPSPPSEF